MDSVFSAADFIYQNRLVKYYSHSNQHRNYVFVVTGRLGITCWAGSTEARQIAARATSPDGRNAIVLNHLENQISFTVLRDGEVLFGPSPLGPELAEGGRLYFGSQVDELISGKVDETFNLPWGKTNTVTDRCSYAVVTLTHDTRLKWQLELRAYDDGVAFRYRLLGEGKSSQSVMR